MYHHKQSYLLVIVLLTLILLQSRYLLKEVKAISLRKHTSIRHESRNQLTTTTAATTLNKLETTQQLNITPISTESYSSVQIEKNQFAIFYIDIPADKGVSLLYHCLYSKGAVNLYTKFNSVPTLSDRGKYLDSATQNLQTSTIKKGSSNTVRLYVFVLNTSPIFNERFFVTAKLLDDDIPDNIGIIIAFSILTPVLIIVVLVLIIVVYIKRKSWLNGIFAQKPIFNNNNDKYNNLNNHSQNYPSSLIQNTYGSSSGGDGYGYGATVNVAGSNNQQQQALHSQYPVLNEQQTTMDTIQQQSMSGNEKK
ncbi:hypothetical protein ABK040_013995 [Willaertia magna]